MRRLTGSCVLFAIGVLCLEGLVYAACGFLPKELAPFLIVFTPFLLPGAVVTFFISGGMCLFDGCTPDRVAWAATVLGFIVNSIVLGLVVQVAGKLYQRVGPVFTSNPHTPFKKD